MLLTRKSVIRSLGHVGPDVFDVVHVSRFLDAIQRIGGQSFHVVILDLGLPDSTGLNGIERLMTLIPETPVIVLSGWDDDEAAIRGIEFGAQEFITKDDLEPKRLVRAIRHAIKRQHFARRSVSFNRIPRSIETIGKDHSQDK